MQWVNHLTLISCIGCRRELAGLQKENAVTQTAAQAAAVTAQSTVREELRTVLEQQRAEAQKEKDTLLLEVSGYCFHMWVWFVGIDSCCPAYSWMSSV